MKKADGTRREKVKERLETRTPMAATITLEYDRWHSEFIVLLDT